MEEVGEIGESLGVRGKYVGLGGLVGQIRWGLGDQGISGHKSGIGRRSFL